MFRGGGIMSVMIGALTSPLAYAFYLIIAVAVAGYPILRLCNKILPGVFAGEDGRPYGEPIMVAAAFVFDLFIGRSNFTIWLGWYLFLYVILSLPWHIYGNILIHLHGTKYCEEHYPDISEWRSSHRTFIYFIYYSLLFYFWWKWII